MRLQPLRESFWPQLDISQPLKPWPCILWSARTYGQMDSCRITRKWYIACERQG